jgi:hypothetical protein
MCIVNTVNGYGNVTVVAKAVTSASGRTKLHLSDCSALNRMHPSELCQASTDVETVCLDDFFEGFSRPINVIKIDVEGAELQALRGMTNLLRRNGKAAILMEFCPRWLREAGSDPTEVLELLRGLGFELSEVDDQTGMLTSTWSEALLDKYLAEQGNGTDLWCIRGTNGPTT